MSVKMRCKEQACQIAGWGADFVKWGRVMEREQPGLGEIQSRKVVHTSELSFSKEIKHR
jgi:hypothetical protein